jgi:DNA (cytosine-5)-methyltransferase 1
MGLPEDYALPQSYNDAYRLAGDGLVVPAVSHLATGILAPIVDAIALQEDEIAA